VYWKQSCSGRPFNPDLQVIGGDQTAILIDLSIKGSGVNDGVQIFV